MDVENVLHKDNIPIPVAKLVFIEVMGQPIQLSDSEDRLIYLQNYCGKIIYNALNVFCTILVFIMCFGLFFMFITGFPFV
jgi:hypothetical protein